MFERRYKNLVKIGEGGRGIVFKGFDTERNIWVAIKFLREREDFSLFRYEFLLAKSLEHPNWVKVYDFGERKGIPYYTMELQKKSLEEVFFTDRTDRLIEGLIGLCDGLDYIHSKGLVHGDIKPSNIFISGKTFKISDFGGIHSFESSEEVEKLGVVTILYASPEILKGLPGTPSSDLYSLGILIYEKLTGKPPFYGGIKDIIEGHLFLNPPPPSTLNPKISKRWDQIVGKLLSKSPKERYSTARELKRSLMELKGDGRGVKIGVELRSGEFINRERERSALIKILKQVLSGRSHFVVITGERGIGKTRLISEIVPLAQVEGFKVLHFKSGKFNIREIEEKLQSLFSNLPPNLSGTKDLIGFLEKIREFLKDNIGKTPLLIVIDPLNPHDTLGINFIEYLSKTFKNSKLLLIAAIDDCKRKFLGRVKVIRLKKFREKDTRRLVESRTGLATRERNDIKKIHRFSMGNPLFINQIIEFLYKRDLIEFGDGDWSIKEILLPSNILELIGKELKDLDGEMDVIKTAALIGEKIRIDLLETLFGRERVLKALEALIERELVRREANGYFFRDPFLKEKITLLIPAREKRKIHRRIFQTLEEKYPKDWRNLYIHSRNAGLRKKYIHYGLMAAREEMLNWNFSEVVHILESIIPLIDNKGDLKTALELFYESCISLGEWDKLEDLLKITLRKKRRMDSLLKFYLANLYIKRGKPKKAESHLLELLKRKDEDLDEKRIRFLLSLLYSTYLGEKERAKQEIERGLSLISDPGEEASFIRILGNIYFYEGNFDNSLRLYERALHLQEKSGNLLEQVRLYNNMGAACQRSMKYRKAENYLMKGISIARKIGCLKELSSLYSNLTLVYGETFELEKQIDAAYKALEIADKLDDRRGQAFSRIVLSAALFLFGRWMEVEEHLNKALDYTEGMVELSATEHLLRFLFHRGLWQDALSRAIKGIFTAKKYKVRLRENTLYSFLSLLYSSKGDFEKARYFAKKTEEVPLFNLYSKFYITFSKGEFEKAERYLNLVESLSSSLKTRFTALLDKAEIKVNIGDVDGAFRLARGALRIFEEKKAHYLASQAKRILGMVYLKAKSWDLAEKYLLEAHREFKNIGAIWFLYRTLPHLAILYRDILRDGDTASLYLSELTTLEKVLDIK
jgi:serine/threonine protein kinase/tetratricopeptide (TPR) repeat protein